MKLVLQRTPGDCGIAAVATLTEQAYEDVYVATSKIDKQTRGRSGIHMSDLILVCRALGVTLVHKRQGVNLDDDEGLLAVRWLSRSRRSIYTWHVVVVGHGVIADPADGVILPADEYLAREKARPGAFLELR